MTKEKFEQAIELQRRMDSIDKLLSTLGPTNESITQMPPIRDSGCSIVLGPNGERVDLNEGEFRCIFIALEAERMYLQREFEKL